jgi:Zn-dependent protease with chaperone function
METKATYYDGVRPLSRGVLLSTGPKGLTITLADGPSLIWPYASIRLDEGDQPHDLPLNLHREEMGAATGERLEITDGAFGASLLPLCPALRGDAALRKKSRNRILFWSGAAVLSLGLMIFKGLPLLADKLAPLVPWSTEEKLGAAVEGQVIAQLTGSANAKFCAGDKPGPASDALAKLVNKLAAQAELPGKPIVRILDAKIPNAFALPGGRLVVLSPLVKSAKSVDEVAGVLAHEMGHMANRDSMRGLIHAGGLSFLVGTLLGDFTGAGALVIASRTLLGNRYSRQNETEADAFAIKVMNAAGGDATKMGDFLKRVASSPMERPLEMLLSHPVTEDRVKALEAGAIVRPGREPLLSAEEWKTLQTACDAT